MHSRFNVILLFLVVCISCTLSRPSTDQPGTKVTLTESSLNYVFKQILPLLQKTIQTTTIPDVHEQPHTPIGRVDISVTSIEIKSLSLSNPSLVFVGDGFKTHLSIDLQMHANWHYREKSFPHISDSGTADLHCSLSQLGVTAGAQVNPAFKSGLKVWIKDAVVEFSAFDVHLHGGASWLYQIFLDALKGNILNAIRDALTHQVPDQVTKLLQSLLDEQDLAVPMPFNVFLRFDPREVYFNPKQKIVTLGASGQFVSKGFDPYPKTPDPMPDQYNQDMVQVFLSQTTLNSGLWIYDELGIAKTLVKPSDIPESWPVQLNTTFFKYPVPGLYEKYPNQLMQILFEADQDNKPTMTISKENGIQLDAQGDGVFQVIQPDKSIVDAFTLGLHLSFSVKGSVKEGSVISGTVTFKNMTVGVEHSSVGDISVILLDTSLKFLMENVIVPILNVLFEKGFPIPQLQQLTLKDPQLETQNGYLMVYSNFIYNPEQSAQIGKIEITSD